MKNLTFLLIAFLSSTLGRAQETESPVKLEDALLWEVSGNGLQKSSYLLGTMHTVEFSFMFDSIPEIRKVLSAVEQVATETDMMAEHSTREKKPILFDDYFLMPADTTYSMLYNVEDFSFVDSVLSSGNARYAERVPAFWQDIYTNYVIYNRIKKENGMDYFLLRLAHQTSKKTFALENIEEVMRKYEKVSMSNYEVSLKKQASSLLFTLKNSDRILDSHLWLDSLYRTRKLSLLTLENLMKELVFMICDGQATVTGTELQNTKRVFGTELQNTKIVLEGRNNAWMLKIPEIIHQGSTLIAVGAMHLTGNAGLINQLRKMGYTVKPVKH